jgi:Polyphosphate kinase 2 (PPK2)
MGFCTPQERALFLRQTPIFEQMLIEDGILLRKYWFSVSDDDQLRRFTARRNALSGNGNSAQWTWNRCTGGRTTHALKTR